MNIVGNDTKAKGEVTERSCIIIAAGGTAGHINPGIAVAEELRKIRPDIEIIFVGRENSMESKLVSQSDFSFIDIPSYPLLRKEPLTWFKFLAKMRAGISKCRKLIKAKKANMVIGMGGFVSTAPLWAAKSLNVPILIHEQNAQPGASNKLMAKYADIACISYEQSEKYFIKAKKILLTGNPLRQMFLDNTNKTIELEKDTENLKKRAKIQLGLEPDSFVIVAMGGSLGAKNINQTVLELMADYRKSASDYPRKLSIILSSGRLRFEDTVSYAEGLKLKIAQDLQLESYLDNVVLYMQAADVIISRAGAIACAEIAALGKASILVPYPYATGNHQFYNAKAFLEAGAAYLLEDNYLTVTLIKQTVIEMMQKFDTLLVMERAATKLAKLEAAKIICQELLEYYPQD